MKQNVILAAFIAIAVALAGCSKGEDGTDNGNNMDIDVKAISADIRKHIVGKWECDGHFGKGFPIATGSTATATFPYTNEREYKKDVLYFYSDGRLVIALEEETEPIEVRYEVPEPDTSDDFVPIARIEIIIPDKYAYGRYRNIGNLGSALFERDYKTLCLKGWDEYWRYRRTE